MNIRPQEVDYRKQIGTLRGKPVMEIGLKGGLHIVCAVLDKAIEYLGAGPHRAVARFLAKKKKPELTITDLAKSEHIDPSVFAHMVPRYETLVDRMNARK